MKSQGVVDTVEFHVGAWKKSNKARIAAYVTELKGMFIENSEKALIKPHHPLIGFVGRLYRRDDNDVALAKGQLVFFVRSAVVERYAC